MTKSINHALTALVLLLCASAVQAAPITYTFNGYMGGSLNGNYFSYAAFEINLLADSEAAWVWGGSEPGWPIYENFSLPGNSWIEIDGVGSATFIQPLWMFARTGGPYAGYPAIAVLNPLAPNEPFPFVGYDDALLGYDLSSSVSANWTTLGFAGFASVPLGTDQGNLLINYSDSFGFSAALVPAPAAVWLFVSGLCMLARVRRSRALP